MAKFRSKKGQLPFVELNGEEIADSAFIIKELSEKFGKDLDAGKNLLDDIDYYILMPLNFIAVVQALSNKVAALLYLYTINH